MPELHPPDRELTDRFLRDRDEAAFRQLYRRYTPRLYALALRLLGGRTADAEDAVQDAWQRAAGALDRFAWRSSLSTWLSSIVINCARERLRSPHLRLVAPAADQDPPAPRTTMTEALDLERAIAALPDGYREVLVLHDIEGLTHDEIAAELGIAPGTSKSQLHHARRALRAALAGHRSEASHARSR